MFDPPQRQRGRDLCDAAGGILVMDDEGVAVAAEIGGHTVDLGDADASAAHRGRFHRKDPAGPARQPQHSGVWVGRAQLDRVDAELHALLSGQPEAVR